jgi:hypothetical protein
VLASHGIHSFPFGELLLELIAFIEDDVELWRVLAKSGGEWIASTHPLVLSEITILVEALWKGDTRRDDTQG